MSMANTCGVDTGSSVNFLSHFLGSHGGRQGRFVENGILAILVVSHVEKLEKSLEDIRIVIRQIDDAADRFLDVSSCQQDGSARSSWAGQRRYLEVTVTSPGKESGLRTDYGSVSLECSAATGNREIRIFIGK